MNRLILIAATALVAIALTGGAILFVGGSNGPAVPTPPRATMTPTASPEPSSELATAPDTLIWGDWLADVEAIPDIDQPAGRIQLSVDWQDGLGVWIQQDVLDARLVVQSISYPAAQGELRVRALTTVGCPSGSEGRYSWDRSTDGLFLTLTLIGDECAARATAFERTWVRSLGAVNDGRRGVVNYFSPAILIDLPEGRWSAGGAGEAADIGEDRGQNLVAIKNPAGLAEPCAPDGGEHIAVGATIDAYSAYLEAMPGFTIESEDVVVGGYPAAHLTVTTDAGIDCPTRRIAEFAPNDLSDTMHWFITPGDPDSIWLVQVDQDLYLLLYPGVTPAEEARVMSTVQFIDELPSP